MSKLKLPIDPLLPEIAKAIRERDALILQASPGSGKTTRVPPALMSALPGEILVLEPRRVAAKYAALRVADEMGEPVGQCVGYQFRFENVGSAKTRLRFLTEGMLMRKLLSDPELKGVSIVILDEFHERHLHSDVALGAIRRLQERRPELKLLVMSATLETEALSRYLEQAPILKVEAPVHPVAIEHLPGPLARTLDLGVREAIARILSSREPDSQGDILVFLPGMGEIRRAESALQDLNAVREGRIRILALHGELSKEEQELAIVPQKFRKIILSTNVAETSLTIEGVTVVIDSGLHRQASHSWWSGVPALRTRPISRASAIQRAGRAGRTAPGRCLRLYTQHEFHSRPAFETPEIRRADLSSTVLELKNLGVIRALEFPWLEPPQPASIEASERLLQKLGFTDPKGSLTALGKSASSFPAHPRIARLMLEASRRGVSSDAAILGALLSEGELEGLDALEQVRRAHPSHGVKRSRSHLLSALERATPPTAQASRGPDALAQSVLAAFPDRIAKKRPIPASSNRGRATDVEFVLSSGGSARAEENSALTGSEYFVALDIQEMQAQGQARSQLKLRSVVPIAAEWLFDLEPSPLTENDELYWDPDKKRVERATRLRCDELVLSEDLAPPSAEQAHEAARVLIRHALGILPERIPTLTSGEWIEALSHAVDSKSLEAFTEALGRLELVEKNEPGLLSRGVTGAKLGQALEELFSGKRSAAELAVIDWAAELPLAAGIADPYRLDQLAPTQFTFPNGRRSRIHYAPDKTPWIESRMQDFFGLKAGPAVLQGRIPLTLHLLAPNHRAVQVTTDLPGFWQRAYPEVRGQLSRRYPRHSWPENPLTLVRDDE